MTATILTGDCRALLAGTPQEPAWGAILSEQGPGAVVDSGEQREGA